MSIIHRPLSLRQAIERLKLGIKATKFHYSKKSKRECLIKLSDEEKTLYQIWIFP